MFILFIVGISIYAIYSFFFSPNKESQIVQNSPKEIVEEQVIVKKEPMVIDLEKAKILVESLENKTVEEVETSQNEQKEITVPVLTTVSNEKHTSVSSFYNYIENKIYSNISQNINKHQIDNTEPVNIRVTILQDGKYEQLTYMGGNKQYFDLIKPYVLSVFPLEIDESIKENFPRYFRMKVEF